MMENPTLHVVPWHLQPHTNETHGVKAIESKDAAHFLSDVQAYLATLLDTLQTLIKFWNGTDGVTSIVQCCKVPVVARLLIAFDIGIMIT